MTRADFDIFSQGGWRVSQGGWKFSLPTLLTRRLSDILGIHFFGIYLGTYSVRTCNKLNNRVTR